MVCGVRDLVVFVFSFVLVLLCSSWLGKVNAHSSLGASVGFKTLTQAVVSLTVVTPRPVVFYLDVQIAHSMYFFYYHQCVAFYLFIFDPTP